MLCHDHGSSWVRRRWAIFCAVALVSMFLLWSLRSRTWELMNGLPLKSQDDKVPVVSSPPTQNDSTPQSDSSVPARPTVRPPSPLEGEHTRTLVLASLRKEDTSWVERELADEPGLKRAVYVVDDESAPFHVPMNKGHEVMVYLTYVIDHYHDLSDVTIFMHAHQYTWHNDDILDSNAVTLVKRLSVDRVRRLGYMNLRCTLRPGCPSHLHPANPVQSLNHPEEVFWPKAWEELFPSDPIPHTVSQSCCAQFAVSKDRIRALSLERYEHFRNWLIKTDMEDRISGRIWEYLWQILFQGENEYCPPQHVCLCDGYGVCFGSESGYDSWMNKTLEAKDLTDRIRTRPGKVADLNEMTARLTRLREEIAFEKGQAFERGTDPAHRAAELAQQCMAPGSMTEWNTAAVAWKDSLACQKAAEGDTI